MTEIEFEMNENDNFDLFDYYWMKFVVVVVVVDRYIEIDKVIK